MAYAALISLKQTLHRLLHSSHIFINISSTRQIIESATSLQRILKRLDDCSSKRLNALDDQIRDVAHNLEDLLELHELDDHILRQSESYADSHQEMDKLKHGIKSFCETAEKITIECIAEIGHPPPQEEEEEDEDDDDDDQAIPSDVNNADYTDVIDHLTERTRPNDFGVFQITGLPGSGATIAAVAILKDLKHCFDCCAGVTVGPIYDRKEILLSCLAQINEHNEFSNVEGDEEKIGEYLYEGLKGRRYIIVLDDIREGEIWNFLESFFPVQDNGSAVVFTTRELRNELLQIRNSFLLYNMACRDQESWWYMFRKAVFEESKPCPLELEEAGKKIVKNCRSLGIVVLKVILLLLKAEKSTEYWNHLAADEENPIFLVDGEDAEMHKVMEELSGVNYSFLDDEERGLLLEFVDFSNHIESIKKEIFPKMFFPKMRTISFLGMVGIGKTSLAKNIFEDCLSIRCHFKHHVWVDLGPEYKPEEILVDLLAQMYPDIDKNRMKGDEDLCMRLCAQFDKKCLIVLDDVWSKETLHYMRRLFPNIKGTTLVTTRLAKVGQIGQGDLVYNVPLLNKEESWDLFCKHLFGEERCPLQLVKAGKKIVDNCEGLPLMIVTVASLLSNMERTPEFWNDVARKNSEIFMAAYNQISKVLVPSYDHLPQYLKLCFLYIGIFPQNKVIPTSKLILFWIAEGFLQPNRSQSIEDYAAECFLELESRSLVMVHQKGSNFKIKTCSLHSVVWHLSNNVAMENKFFHAFTTYADIRIEDMAGQRRLCIRNNTLLGIKDVHDSIASISTTRSLLCTGPSHQYPVQVYFGFRLLRLMDALSIRLYEFPIEVVKSYYLRYLALTHDGSLPPCVSQLWNLQFLIVRQHLNIKSSIMSSYLPMEIWDMEELKHLQIAGRNLPNPHHGVVLKNLLTLLDVSGGSCTKKVLKRIPNLKKLGIQIELAPDEEGNYKPFHFLNRISRLRKLESLKCVVVNPEFMSEIVPPPAPRSMFPPGLRKLSLSGLGYTWKYMKIISNLENLEVLKLRCYAFQGPEWEMDDDDLFSVQFLLIEDTDLIRWKFTTVCFVSLKCLSIKHCYQLEELPRELCTSVETLEVVECNPFVHNWAMQLEEDVLNFKAISSWDN